MIEREKVKILGSEVQLPNKAVNRSNIALLTTRLKELFGNCVTFNDNWLTLQIGMVISGVHAQFRNKLMVWLSWLWYVVYRLTDLDDFLKGLMLEKWAHGDELINIVEVVFWAYLFMMLGNPYHHKENFYVNIIDDISSTKWHTPLKQLGDGTTRWWNNKKTIYSSEVSGTTAMLKDIFGRHISIDRELSGEKEDLRIKYNTHLPYSPFRIALAALWIIYFLQLNTTLSELGFNMDMSEKEFGMRLVHSDILTRAVLIGEVLVWALLTGFTIWEKEETFNFSILPDTDNETKVK